ncbi:hypothetical protein ABOM_007879 [Aspergillus bombycis]|uniref:Uncharacterized protein n=1 Tax=Aspergillus bombycis TaxID=109264 RepID=A0A1F7ZS93_9EURO|nr:hypothetical protein ABOM_007879 [Aspergillus bombycis]OGM42331.1 hypothetical protein ABOM_007879 [Aspergillus bombycis]
MPPSFAEDASLVLVGMRCAGKSSLATIASRALKWKVVDEKLQFEKVTGYSVAGYIEKYGHHAYCAQEVSVLKAILAQHQRRYIIVCSSSCVQTQAGQDLLREYLATLPIVHVMRDRHVLQANLESKWQGDVIKVLREQEPVYLSCSNLTFFNRDDTSLRSGVESNRGAFFEALTPTSGRPTYRSLSLKHVESDFLRFLSSIYDKREEKIGIGTDWDIFTYSLQLPFRDFKACGFELDRIACCADVLQVQVDLLLQGYLETDTTRHHWWEYVVDQLAFLRRHTTQPILYHATSGNSPPSQLKPDYFDLIQLGLRVGAEFVTVDLRQGKAQIQAVTDQKGHSKIVGWFYDSDPGLTGGWTGQRRLEWYRKAVDAGCDIVQLTQPAITRSDNAAAQCFAESMNNGGPLPVSAYNTNRLGRPSQCFNKLLTPVAHPDVIRDEPGTITIPQVQAALFASFTCEPLRFFVMGSNVRYSVAPVLHNSAFDVYGMPHIYSILQTDTFDTLNDVLQEDDMGGLGLSSPFKTAIIPRLKSMSSDARFIGAVNTILPIRNLGHENAADSNLHRQFSIAEQRNRAGPVLALHGENTDWKGIRACVIRHLSPVNAVTSVSTALVIGAGGMARAAIYALIQSGIRHILIYNRTPEHAMELVDHFERMYRSSGGDLTDNTEHNQGKRATISIFQSLQDPWPSNLRLPTVIVNCSPIPGDRIMPAPLLQENRVEFEPAVSVPTAWLKSPTGGVYLELAYNSSLPSPELLRICSNQGWIGVAGLEIFIEVASAQFEFWTGRRAPTYIMKRKLGQYLRELQDSM